MAIAKVTATVAPAKKTSTDKTAVAGAEWAATVTTTKKTLTDKAAV